MCVDTPSVNLVITIPRVVSDLLIVFASSRVYPAAPVLEIFSDPARSTKKSLPVFLPLVLKFSALTVMIKTECDLELYAFILV